MRHRYGGNGHGRHTDRWRVLVAQAYGTATRGALEELRGLPSDVLLGALDLAETPGALSGPHAGAQAVLRAALPAAATPAA